MRFEYFDMLSGEPIFVQGIGHLRSPSVRDLCPMSGVGYRTYNFYLNVLSWDKGQILHYDQLMQYRGTHKLNRDAFNTFDIATLLAQTRELCRGVLSFFMLENLVWDEGRRCYLVMTDDEEPTVVGEIDRDNFDEVRDMMLQLNFIGLDKDEAPVTHSDAKSKELWEKVQGHLKEQSRKNAKEDKPEYRLSNIISKVCAIHPSYNLLNIYDLTIFQLYDSFFQVSYMRSSDINEQIFSNHGGDKFKFEDWLKPILKNL